MVGFTLSPPRCLDACMGVQVTSQNYATAMFDMAMQREVVNGADNGWHHHRVIMPLDEQPAPMMNRDTLYSFVIADARGDLRVVLPETDGRYQSLHVVNSDHVTFAVEYGAGDYVIPAEGTTDFVVLNVRTQIDPNDPTDQAKVNAYQDQLVFEHLGGYEPSPFMATDWDLDSFSELHRHNVAIATRDGVRGTMGTVDAPVTLEDKNRGVSIATGLLPDRDAMYISQRLHVDPTVPNTATYAVPALRDPSLGFYSITVYGDDQYLKTDDGSILSDREIVLNADGQSFEVTYLGANSFDAGANRLQVPTPEFWINFRIYMPTDELLTSTIELPMPAPR